MLNDKPINRDTHLVANKISVLQNHTLIFRRVSLSVCAGELWYFKGENGSGKTTLLRALAGLLPIQSGTITRYSDVLYLGHLAGIKSQLTVYENLFYLAKQHHKLDEMTATAMQPMIEEAIAQVGLSHRAHYPARYLSAGQARRAQLARLWLCKTPSLWLLDEPLTALDSASVERLSQRCLAHVKSGGSLLLTSHQEFDLKDYPYQIFSLPHH